MRFVVLGFDRNMFLRRVGAIDARDRAAAVDLCCKDDDKTGSREDVPHCRSCGQAIENAHSKWDYPYVFVLTPAEARRIGKAGAL